jgi:hypothetical protein
LLHHLALEIEHPAVVHTSCTRLNACLRQRSNVPVGILRRFGPNLPSPRDTSSFMFSTVAYRHSCAPYQCPEFTCDPCPVTEESIRRHLGLWTFAVLIPRAPFIEIELGWLIANRAHWEELSTHYPQGA